MHKLNTIKALSKTRWQRKAWHSRKNKEYHLRHSVKPKHTLRARARPRASHTESLRMLLRPLRPQSLLQFQQHSLRQTLQPQSRTTMNEIAINFYLMNALS